MAQNVVVGIFAVESEAYQAITEVKRDPGDEKNFVVEAVLVKKENGTLKTLDGFDTGVNTTNDTAIGGLCGSLFGILGGPIGVLLGGTYGALIGSVIDADDALDNASIIEQIATKLNDGEVAIIGLTSEEDEAVLDAKMSKFDAIVLRYDAETVADEVERAQELADEMAREAHIEMGKKALEDGKKKIKKWFKAKENELADAAEEKADAAFDNSTLVTSNYTENFD